MVKKSRHYINLALGTLLSAVLAALVTLLFNRSTWRAALPLAFVFVLVLLSKQFGVSVSLTGSLSAAIVFSMFLFPPIGSTQVENDHARMNLAWMILSAVAVSYLLYPRTPIGRH